jgi:hypothetical protein
MCTLYTVQVGRVVGGRVTLKPYTDKKIKFSSDIKKLLSDRLQSHM